MPSALRRHPVAIILLLIALSSLLWKRSGGIPLTADDYSRYHNQTFKAVKVVDGDTIDIDVPDRRYPTTRIRLWGVDTPEVASTGQTDMFFGNEASQFTKSTALNQRVRVELSPRRTRDKYGRLLAYVYIEHEMLNELLIRTGHAYADRRFQHAYSSRFRDVEERARRDKAGLWAAVTFDDYPAWLQRMETRSK